MTRKKPPALRWLVYATNGWGLGHITRTMALARQIKRRAPDSEFLFVTNSEASNLTWREGFACVKLPSVHAIDYGFIERDVAVPLGRALTANVYAAFRPHVLLSDSYAVGGNTELAPLVYSQVQKVLIHREVTKEVRESSLTHYLLGLYDLILVPHEPGETEISVPKGVPVKETGHMMIRSREEALPRAEARRRLGLPADGFLVFVGLGGGGDYKYQEYLDRILAEMKALPGWTLVCAAPPLLRDSAARSAAEGLHVIQYFPLAEAWNAFDAAITLRGTNTTAELLHNGIPTVFMPVREGLVDDQAARGARIAKAKAGWVMTSFDGAELEAAVAAIADPGWRAATAANARRMIPENGAEAAADFLLDHLSKIENLGRA